MNGLLALVGLSLLGVCSAFAADLRDGFCGTYGYTAEVFLSTAFPQHQIWVAGWVPGNVRLELGNETIAKAIAPVRPGTEICVAGSFRSSDKSFLAYKLTHLDGKLVP